MRKSTRLAVAGILAMLAPMLVKATPILGGSAYLDRDSGAQIFEINAEGYADLLLTFSATGGGSIDDCANLSLWYRDCLSVNMGETEIFGDLAVPIGSQDFSASLPTADSSFDLIFDASISGSDESITIAWLVSGEEIADDRVIDVPEPGIVALFGLGLLSLALTRRRRS